MKNYSPFEYSGFATLSDLNNEEIKAIYSKLSKIQEEFLEKEGKFRSPEYKWPRDPLNTWSRIWEYPYAYYHLEKEKRDSADKLLKVADVGSGVTFFPFAVSRLGYEVTCIDIDPICARDIPAAAAVVDARPGSVGVSLLKNGSIALDDCSQDVVYCISVLEHVPNFEKSIEDIARILKQNGKFILTVDIDLRGDFELSADDFRRLESSLSIFFQKETKDRISHPLDYLTSASSPNKITSGSTLSKSKRIVSRALEGNLFKGDPSVHYHLAVYGGVYIKK